MNIAALNLINRNTVPALKILLKSLKKKSTSFSKIIKIGRTHFMDTVITLGQEFSGYVSQIEKGLKKIYESCDNLSELAIGGTAVGTGLNTINGFDKLVVRKVNYFNKIIVIKVHLFLLQINLRLYLLMKQLFQLIML